MNQPDVIVVGGGVIGLSAAFRLRQDGLSVTLLEQGRCGLEASWASAGVLTPCSWHRTDGLAQMHRDALFRYADWATRLKEISGIDPEFRRCGRFKLLFDDNHLRTAANEVRAVADRTTPEGEPIVKTLSPPEAVALEPQLTSAVAGVQHCRLTAQVRNPRLLQALKIACERTGVVIRENVTATGLVRNDTRVTGVRTDQGEAGGQTIIICTGAWSSLIDDSLKQYAPVYPVRGQILLLYMNPLPVRHIISADKFYIVPRSDGHIVIGSTEEHDSGFRKHNTAAGVAKLSELALRYVPALADATMVRMWAGLRPGTPDRKPFIGFVPGQQNLIVATGHFRTGMVLAPITADVIADLLKTGTCPYDLSKATPGRTFHQQSEFRYLPWNK